MPDALPLSLLLALFAAPQDTGDPRALLRELVEAQKAPGAEAPPPPARGFELELVLTEQEHSVNALEIRLAYVDYDGGLYRAELRDLGEGTKVRKGYDGETWWLQSEDGRLTLLEGRDFRNDRQRIEEEMDLCQDFLLFFDLDRLAERARALRVEGGDLSSKGLAGVLERGGRPWSFLLQIGEDGLPLAFDLWPPPEEEAGASGVPGGEASGGGQDGASPQEPADEDAQRIRFRLLEWTEVEGRRVPLFVEEYRGRRLDRPVRYYEFQRLVWRTPPPRRSFRRPDA